MKSETDLKTLSELSVRAHKHLYPQQVLGVRIRFKLSNKSSTYVISASLSPKALKNRSPLLTAYTAFSRGVANRPTQREERVWKSNLRLLDYTGSRSGFVPHKAQVGLSSVLHSRALEQRCARILTGWSGRCSAG